MKEINYRKLLIVLFFLLSISLSAWATDFFNLCKLGTLEEIQKAIQSGANVNDVDENGRTPLMFATMQNPDPEVIRILLQAGADVDKQDKYGFNSLICAAMHRNPEVVKILLQAGADIDSKDLTGGTSLVLAVAANPDPEVTKTLLQAGADVNSISNNGRTPLIFAAFNNASPEVIKTLLQAGADPFITDKEGKRAVDYVQKGTAEYQLLAQATNMDEGEKRKQSAFEGLFGGIETISGETLIKYNGEIKGLAGLQLDTNPYQNVNRFEGFDAAMMMAGIDHLLTLTPCKAEQRILDTGYGMMIHHTTDRPYDFLFQVFEEKETRRVILIALRLQLYWDIRDKYGSLLETVTALINGINTACGIKLDKDVDYNIVKQMILGETVLVVAGKNYELLYGYLYLPDLASDLDQSFDLSFGHHLFVFLSPSRYSDKLDEQVNPALPNSEDLETEASQIPTITYPLKGSLHCPDKRGYPCVSCSSAKGYDNHFKGFNVLTINEDCYVKLIYNNGDYIGNQNNCEVTIKGEKWLGLENESGAKLVEKINKGNFDFKCANKFNEGTMKFPGDNYKYEFANEGRELRLYLSRDRVEAFKAVPWQNIIIEIKNKETNKVFTYKFQKGIFPQAYSWSNGGVANYGQCVWWTAKRWVEEVNSKTLFPFYPPSPQDANVIKIDSNYQPKKYDILINYDPNNTSELGHYGFVEKVDGDKVYITQFNWLKPGEVYNHVPRPWNGNAKSLYYSNNPSDLYYFKYYYRK